MSYVLTASVCNRIGTVGVGASFDTPAMCRLRAQGLPPRACDVCNFSSGPKSSSDALQAPAEMPPAVARPRQYPTSRDFVPWRFLDVG